MIQVETLAKSFHHPIRLRTKTKYSASTAAKDR
jgi:hypothetical protein